MVLPLTLLVCLTLSPLTLTLEVKDRWTTRSRGAHYSCLGELAIAQRLYPSHPSTALFLASEASSVWFVSSPTVRFGTVLQSILIWLGFVPLVLIIWCIPMGSAHTHWLLSPSSWAYCANKELELAGWWFAAVSAHTLGFDNTNI